MSNALMEAMAIGMPCIATDIGGNRDLIAPGIEDIPAIPPGSFRACTQGILVNPDDPTGIKNAIEFLQGNIDVRMCMGVAARTWIGENVALSVVAEKYRNLYRRMLELE